MARIDGLRRFTPSLLDRLIGGDDTTASPRSRGMSLSELRQSVTRDLENLLNTRRVLLGELPERLTEVCRSLQAYGLPDFSSSDLRVEEDRLRIEETIQQAVERFEPRLERVVVFVDETRSSSANRRIHFRIDADLKVEPNPEPVMFDAVLELTSQQYEVKGEG